MLAILYDFIEQNKEPTEEFKEVQGTSGKYFVSSFGRVISFCDKKEPRFLKPWKASNGYLCVSLNKSPKNQYIHILVAQAFIEKPLNKEPLLIHHKDFNKQNNRAENLIYLTTAEHNKIHHGKGAVASGKA